VVLLAKEQIEHLDSFEKSSCSYFLVIVLFRVDILNQISQVIYEVLSLLFILFQP